MTTTKKFRFKQKPKPPVRQRWKKVCGLEDFETLDQFLNALSALDHEGKVVEDERCYECGGRCGIEYTRKEDAKVFAAHVAQYEKKLREYKEWAEEYKDEILVYEKQREQKKQEKIKRKKRWLERQVKTLQVQLKKL